MINFSSRTTKRPVPLEHCLFYSGELYKICESETILPQGLKAAKDAFKKKNSTGVVGGSSRQHSGTSAGHDNARAQKRESAARVKHGSSFSKNGRGYQNNGNGQSNWDHRRAEASMWLMLINKLSKKSLLPVCQNVFGKVYFSTQSYFVVMLLKYWGSWGPLNLDIFNRGLLLFP